MNKSSASSRPEPWQPGLRHRPQQWVSTDFRRTVLPCGHLPASRRHGITDDDILHAVEHAMLVDDLGEDPDRWPVIGPDRAAHLLEVICP